MGPVIRWLRRGGWCEEGNGGRVTDGSTCDTCSCACACTRRPVAPARVTEDNTETGGRRTRWSGCRWSGRAETSLMINPMLIQNPDIRVLAKHISNDLRGIYPSPHPPELSPSHHQSMHSCECCRGRTGATAFGDRSGEGRAVRWAVRWAMGCAWTAATGACCPVTHSSRVPPPPPPPHP